LLVGLPLLLKPKDGGAGPVGADDAEGAEGADATFGGVPTGGTTRSCPSAERRAAREVGDSPGLKRGEEFGFMMVRVRLERCHWLVRRWAGRERGWCEGGVRVQSRFDDQ
jgi:hypothetical protein